VDRSAQHYNLFSRSSHPPNDAVLNTRTAAPAAQSYATTNPRWPGWMRPELPLTRHGGMRSVNESVANLTEPSQQFPLPPDPDDTLDHLISALRTHPNEQVRALAKTTRSEVRRIHQAQQRQLAAQRRTLTIKRLELITAQVACALRVDPVKLTSRARQQHIVFCRQVAMYLGKNLTAASFPTLGASFGRDHSTALAACAAIERRLADESHGPRFRRFIEQLKAQLGGMVTTTAAV
jgi:hypothetical protein